MSKQSTNNTDLVTNMATLLRPATFSDMVGQPYATGVGEKIGSGRVSGQGYLIIGPKGCGKTTLARIIASSLNCTHRDESTGDPCGECLSCLSYADGSHREIMEINAAAYRGINDIKEKISGMSTTIPQGYRVYIIDEAHMLTNEAFSALLKPLEESYDNVVFILTTTNPEKIIDTVRSRLVAIPVRSMSSEDQRILIDRAIERGKELGIEEWSTLTQDDINQAILSSGGSGRQALTNASGIVYHGVHATLGDVDVSEVVDNFIKGSTAAVLSQCDKILSDKTSDPVALITMIINTMMEKVTQEENPSSLALQVSKLSQVLDSIDVSTPSSIVSAKIASCVSTPSQQTLSSTHPELSPKKAKKKSKKPYKVNSKSNIDKVIDILLESDLSQEHIDDDLYDILSDEDETDIIIDDNGDLMVAVKSPNSTMIPAIRKVISNSYISKKAGDNLYEPPF